jgi:1-acyl-sn-glycerol-3-phosphate acyltransferase
MIKMSELHMMPLKTNIFNHMKYLRIIFLFPLALIRLIFIVIMSAYVVTVGWFWLKIAGFNKHLQQWVMRTWGKSILLFCGIRVERNELPALDNFILMSNHRSYIDIFIMSALSPAAMVAKSEIKNWPLGKLGIKITSSILVDRTEIKSLVKTMNAIKQTVNSGIPVILFPEGATYKGPLTKPFKNGSFQIAAETNIPIIPMAIHYKDENDAWVGNDNFLPHFFRQMGKPFTRVYLKYGIPVSGPDYKEIQNETKMQIDKMLAEIIDTHIN